ncbi:helix-turn-helix domain-containing protein [Bradyrhizobium sp. SHOUNA76]|uniref:helix-turn-helix domain-containing protein n=1 Tax=Bradyrhizobium sp. SHOUNA76 TaxID=2908927 RepID=UPI001FF358C9|nr:helix-turn-helix domain-containing protein [Bradyrhizobium sp. SHOUNA76]MCJ9700148.1 helix-turn-helix domain-containing protein [Bradyrhizobium sp. SHOUNA76]
MSRNNAKIKSEAPILTSPEGVKIQITAGRKLQMIRSFAHDPEITDAQFRALVCITDRLNEGRSGDESRWGSAYPNYETLAKDIAKDERAAKRIIKELKTGQREIRSKSGERKLVPCKAVLNVRSTKKGKSDEVNEYRLKNWGAFAVAPAEGAFTAPPQSKEGAVTGQEGGGDLSEGVRSPIDEGVFTAPNSSHGPRSETHPKDPSQSAPASGERGPAVGSVDDDRPRTGPADDLPDDWPTDWRDQFWNAYPVRKNVKAAEAALLDVAKAGVKFESVLVATRRYDKELHDRDRCKDPVKWLADEPWKDNAKARARASRGMPFQMAI